MKTKWYSSIFPSISLPRHPFRQLVQDNNSSLFIPGPVNMAPSAIESSSAADIAFPRHKPLRLSGALDAHDSFDVTPIIGREFPSANLVDWLNAPNADDLLRDLAITSRSSCPRPHPCRSCRCFKT